MSTFRPHLPAASMMRWVIAAATALVVLASAASARAGYAPLDQPGPPLSVPPNLLAASLTCTPDLGISRRTAVLLVPATTVTPQEQYSWNWEPALTRLRIPWCAVKPPDHTLGDIQLSAEYVVYAIRAMHARTGRKISIYGQSQGAVLPRWALRFWPDLRPMVDHVISAVGSNHGTLEFNALCEIGRAHV